MKGRQRGSEANSRPQHLLISSLCAPGRSVRPIALSSEETSALQAPRRIQRAALNPCLRCGMGPVIEPCTFPASPVIKQPLHLCSAVSRLHPSSSAAIVILRGNVGFEAKQQPHHHLLPKTQSYHPTGKVLRASTIKGTQ